MPKRLHLEPHLDTDELARRYRRARDPVARSHLHIIWQLSQGKRTREVAEATGYSPAWIRTIARRYNEGGAEGIGDRRHHNPGGTERALVGAALREELGQALQAPPPGGGLWNSAKVAAWIAAKTGKPVRVQRGWEYLRRLEHTLQVPRPVHAKADPAQQAAFRKNCLGGCER